MASNAEFVSIWWRHHEMDASRTTDPRISCRKRIQRQNILYSFECQRVETTAMHKLYPIWQISYLIHYRSIPDLLKSWKWKTLLQLHHCRISQISKATLFCFYIFAYKTWIEVFGDCANEYLFLQINYINNCLCWKWLIFILLMCYHLLMNADPTGVLCSQAIIMYEKQGTNSDKMVVFVCLWQKPVSVKIVVKSTVPGYGKTKLTWLTNICIKSFKMIITNILLKNISKFNTSYNSPILLYTSGNNKIFLLARCFPAAVSLLG